MSVDSPGDVVRVLMCDDHAVLLESLSMALGRDPRFSVVHRCTSGAETIGIYDPDAVDLVVMDAMMSPLGGAEATALLVERDPDVRVLVLSAFSDPHLVRSCVEAGALGYMLKTSNVRELKDAAVQVARGMVVLDSDLDLRPGSTRLPPRQLEVLELLAQGMNRRQVADAMHISLNTVKCHIHEIYSELGVGTALEAVAKARELRLLSSVLEPEAPGAR